MPSYAFRILSTTVDSEPVWIDFTDDNHVRKEAVKTAAGFMHEHGPIPVSWSIVVHDTTGKGIAKVSFMVE